MGEAVDLADKNRAGTLPTDPKADARPMNAQARREVEERITVLTTQEILMGAQTRALSRERVDFCTTGHWLLDEKTGGIRGQHGWVFAAETNWGKTAWLVSVADENLKAGKPVLIVSSEDDQSIYGDRLLVRRARCNATRLRNRTLTSEEQDRVKDVVTGAEKLPVFVDARGKSLKSVLKKCEELIRAHGIRLIAFDYLQEFRSDRRYQDERVRFKELAAELRGVAKDNAIPSIVFSQITVSEGKKYPDKYSIRESKDVANAAEFILLGMTAIDDIPRPSGDAIGAGTRCVKVDKGKDAAKCLVPMSWNEEGAFFETVKDPDVAPDDYSDQFEERY
jgi:replicative DNA helicase